MPANNEIFSFVAVMKCVGVREVLEPFWCLRLADFNTIMTEVDLGLNI